MIRLKCVFRCPFNSRATQEGRRQLHVEPSATRPETHRQPLEALTRIFHLCCRVRCNSVLYSCFLLLACCSSGRREDPFLRFLASVWLLCDEADATLKTIDPTDPPQWQAAVASAKSPSSDLPAAADQQHYPHSDASMVSASGEGEPTGSPPAEGSAHRGGKGKGGGRALRRLLSGASLSRTATKPSSSGAKEAPEAPGLPATRRCSFLAASRCQCVAYVRGFIAGVLPALLWSYLTRSLLPLRAQPLPHLLVSVLEEAKRGHCEWETENGAPSLCFFPHLRESLLQRDGKEGGQLTDNSSGLEDLLLLFAGSAEGVPIRKKERRSFGAAVAASAMLPQALHLDGPRGAETPEANSLLELLATFAGGNRCTSLLAVQQQRSIRLRGMVGCTPSREGDTGDRQLEEGGAHLVVSSEGEAEAPQRCREHLVIQRGSPPQATFMTTEGVQDLCVRILSCFSCYANACCVLEGSVATAASSADGGSARESDPLPKRMSGGPPRAASWAQCALWAQQQLLLSADDHAALLAAGLFEAMSSPKGFTPLSLGSLVPQALLLLAQQQQHQVDAETIMGEANDSDVLATLLVDGALLPLDCSCGGVDAGQEEISGGHCLNAAVASRVSVEVLLHLEVDPCKTGQALLAVGEPLMLQICRTLGSLMHVTKAGGSTRVPSWTIPLGGVDCQAHAVSHTEQQWLTQLQMAASYAASAEQQLYRLLRQGRAATANSGEGLSMPNRLIDSLFPNSHGTEPLPQEALQHQLHLMLMLHQAQHFGCNCCCCSFADNMGCSQLGYLVDLSAASYRTMWGRSGEVRPNASTGSAHLWPLLRRALLTRRLQSAARSCMLKAERDWLPQSYWAFVALGTIL